MLNRFKEKNFWLVITTDAFLLCCAYYFAHWLRFDKIPRKEMMDLLNSVIWIVTLKLGIFFFMNLYEGMWRYTGLSDILNIIKANVLALLLIALILGFGIRFQGISRGVILIDFILSTGFISGFRITLRLYFQGYFLKNNSIRMFRKISRNIKRVLIVGAGDTGEKLLREIDQNQKLDIEVVGFVDDNPFKQRHSIHGVRVLGNRNDIPGLVVQYQVDEIIIAIPTATAQQIRQVVNCCESTKKPFKAVPSMAELINGEVSMSAIREVRYEDLLGRKPVCLENDEICRYISGNSILRSR